MSDISLRATFERFPATVKGAFVVRGEDADPHQVAFRQARVVRVPGSRGREIPLTEVVLDVPPHRDVFFPFEFPISDLEPAWYGLEADVDVDGTPRTIPGGRSFCVPWPRGTVRSVNLKVGRVVDVGDAKVSIDRCQSGAEGLTIRFGVQPPQEVALRLSADGSKLDLVEQHVDDASGKALARGYPLLKTHRTLVIEVVPSAGGSNAEVEVDLPA